MEGRVQPADIVMSEAVPPPPSQQPQLPTEHIPATLSHSGRFIQYNIFGNIFEVTSKYKPPIMPIGKGAYGITEKSRHGGRSLAGRHRDVRGGATATGPTTSAAYRAHTGDTEPRWAIYTV
ncbi:Mitogen-activated protein kinase [Forsythia ovata]|uniref:Mitogen-activated protein kinase n=1 Tax=Forsythia ovata TaxID=205694 RepID=A0ABD1TC07_9LAMI